MQICGNIFFVIVVDNFPLGSYFPGFSNNSDPMLVQWLVQRCQVTAGPSGVVKVTARSPILHMVSTKHLITCHTNRKIASGGRLPASAEGCSFRLQRWGPLSRKFSVELSWSYRSTLCLILSASPMGNGRSRRFTVCQTNICVLLFVI